jgi:dTDP-4-amino-4,6-dideoxygalactose transaminase
MKIAGALATLSFDETKNFTCGEDGALLINDPGYIERAEIVREKGTNRSRPFRGQVDKYTWVDLGSSYLPSDVLATFLCAHLESSEQIQSVRQRVWAFCYHSLTDWAEENNVQLPIRPSTASTPTICSTCSCPPSGASGLRRSPDDKQHRQCLPLPSAAPVQHGATPGWKAGRLSGYRNGE